jgi:hypothetical protein
MKPASRAATNIEPASELTRALEPSLGRATAQTKLALISRRWDFWLIGGASLPVWLCIVFLKSIASGAALQSVIFLSQVISVFIFYPHFYWTYRFAYSRGWSFARRYWFQLVFVPAALVLGGVTAFFTFKSTFGGQFAGLTTFVGLGQAITSGLITFMIFTIGWHHSKQTYGCLMAYAHFDKYSLDTRQRNLLRYTAYGFWIINIITQQSGGDRIGSFLNIPIYRLQLPELFLNLSLVVFWSFLAYVGYCVLYRNWRDYKTLPSKNFLIPLVALTLWWIPPFYQPEFYLFFSTTFHALQYWPFAMRYEREKSGPSFRMRRLMMFNLVAMVFGGLAFFVLPIGFDKLALTETIQNTGFFLAFSHAALNIHHYYMDNAIWRGSQSEMQNYILRREPRS